MKKLSEFTNQEIFEIIENKKEIFYNFKKPTKIDKYAVDFHNKEIMIPTTSEIFYENYPFTEVDSYALFNFDEIFILD